ncbi:MAG: glycosyltransferase [Clostridiaceae bacterium]|nr:glycosyltransferase [Clostridiaceae bacterium]
MKKLVEINVCNFGSTGHIMYDLAEVASQNGFDTRCAYGRSHLTEERDGDILIGSRMDVYRHALYARITNRTGFGRMASYGATENLVSRLKEWSPDVIHLHNLHGYYINLPVLFSYLSECDAKIVYTLHDCWPFTGQCGHFTACECDRWKDGCHNCPQTRTTGAKGLIDSSKYNWSKKKALFTSIPENRMSVVTVSDWLESVALGSFLEKYRITSIHNGIDLSVYRPMQNNFRKQYALGNKRIVLGVASVWSEKKGLNQFIRLANMLNDDAQIVLVGLSERQRSVLPKKILGLPRTDSQKELVELYSAADIYVNLSLEESFGLTTVEAMACGTPAIVWKSTSNPEVLGNNPRCGVAVKPGALMDIAEIINNLDFSGFDPRLCVERGNKYEKHTQFMKYLELFT